MKIRGLEKLEKALKAENEKIHATIIRELSRIANKGVRQSVDRSQAESWYDRSGNLRSSIGYGISYNGVVQKLGGFNRVRIGIEGVKRGKFLAISELAKQRKGYGMAIVVGMPYAEKLEMIKGINILDVAELIVEQEVSILGQKIKISVVRL